MTDEVARTVRKFTRPEDHVHAGGRPDQHRATGEKYAIGKIRARSTGNLFLMVQRVAHGAGMSDQMRGAISA